MRPAADLPHPIETHSPHPPGGGTHAAPRSRLAWLDLFRGACVIGMVETHVLNAFLARPLRETAWFDWLTYFDGLIAPAFLFIAGYAQGLGMRQTDGVRRGWGRKMWRLGEVWLLGYALHFPAPQLLAGQWDEAWRLGTQVDVLPCLAVSLALLLAAERWARRWVNGIAVVLLGLAVFGEDAVAGWSFAPSWLLGYFNASTGSLFPLLPWMGFVCAGFLASAACRRRGDETPSALHAGVLVAICILPLVMVFTLAFAAPGSAGFFFERLVWLLAAVPLAILVADRVQPGWLLFAGRESLTMYAVHLLLIEMVALAAIPRGTCGVAGCALIFAGVLAVTYAAAAAWRKWRT